MWRLVLDRIATLEEIERSWNFNDIMKANALLDYRADQEALDQGTKP